MIPAALAQRVRLPLGFAGAIAYLLFVRPTPSALAAGVGTACIGLVIRGWAAGHLVKNDRLTTSGPYAYTRNPLYLGSFLLAAGFALAAHWALVGLVTLFFALIYLPTMRRERDNLRVRYGAAYEEYAAHVPLFLPRAVPFRDAANPQGSTSFSATLYVRHREWQAALGFAGALVWLVFRMGRAA